MAREELESASEALAAASDAAADESTAERLREQADQLARLAERAEAPDHGRLARHEHVLGELQAGADDAVAERVADAKAHVSAYRETIEGV